MRYLDDDIEEVVSLPEVWFGRPCEEGDLVTYPSDARGYSYGRVVSVERLSVVLEVWDGEVRVDKKGVVLQYTREELEMEGGSDEGSREDDGGRVEGRVDEDQVRTCGKGESEESAGEDEEGCWV